MALIKSISGIRGTIGGAPGEGLTPLDAVKFVSAYGMWIKRNTTNKSKLSVVVGRDARVSGEMLASLIKGTLSGLGINIIDIGLATTPTTELAVVFEKADGGLILTASHNPGQWNALKLLNGKGEFLSKSAGEEILDIAEKDAYIYAEVAQLGAQRTIPNYEEKHIEYLLSLKLVDKESVAKKKFKVAVDAVNSVGGIAVPKLLKALGVKDVELIYCEPNGLFPHNPEPLAENLKDLCALVKEKQCGLGVAVDPDVDRLVLIDEKGEVFGEEYTLVAIADYVLGENGGGNVVSNLSSSRALRDLAEARGGKYSSSAVGEVHVVEQMKAVDAIVGGEGNGGVIYPASHHGRDALVGIALLLTFLSKQDKPLSALKASYPEYHMAKKKIEVDNTIDIDEILKQIENKYQGNDITTIDGLKIDFPERWVHLRRSNTEPIIRIYTESKSIKESEDLADKFIEEIAKLADKNH